MHFLHESKALQVCFKADMLVIPYSYYGKVWVLIFYLHGCIHGGG